MFKRIIFSALLLAAPALADLTKVQDEMLVSGGGGGSGDVEGPAASIDSELVLFDGVTGKLIKRATGTGVCKATSGVFSVSAVDLTTEVTGVLPIANGGTNKNLTLAAGGVPYFDADSFEVLGAGTAGQFLKSNGTSAPTWAFVGGGGGSIKWTADGPDAPALLTEFHNEVYSFADGLSQNLYGVVKVSQSYIAGNPIKVRFNGYHQAASATQLLLCQSTLIEPGDAFDNTTDQRTSTNTAQTAASKEIVEHVCDITDSSGQINSNAVAAGDQIRVRVYRSTDSSTSDLSMIPSSTEVTFQ